jgi:DNA-binding MarR family transcriptional regulator
MKLAPNLLYLRDEELNDGIELFFFAQRDFSRAADSVLAKSGLGRAHHRAIYFISRRPNIPVSDLIGILGITKQSLNRVLKILTGEGFIVLAPGVRDRRQRLLNLTPKGQVLADQLSRIQRDRFAQAYRGAGPDAVSGFRRILTGLLSDRERAGVLRLIAKA